MEREPIAVQDVKEGEGTMTRIVVDADLLEKLGSLIQPTELCDAKGRVLARLTPVYDPAEFGPLEPQVSDEELARREKSTARRYSTAEVLKHLEQL
jgi:hypothetical protein